MLRLLLGVVFVWLTAMGGSALSQTYPQKPVRLVNPFPAGSPSDNAARLFAKKLQDQWNQPVIVENRPGAGGTIGTAYVARAEPDGYTLVLGSASTHVVATVMRKSLPYDPNKDFVPIVVPGPYPQVVIVSANLPIKSLADLVSYAKANPGKLAYASSGSGSVLHLAGEMFASVTGVQLLHVPYKGANDAMHSVLAGSTQLIFDSPGSSLPHIQDGKVRALAVMQDKRWFSLPDVPTTAELGFPQLRFSNWSGLYAPRGTPEPVIEEITRSMHKVLKDEQVVRTLRDMNAPVAPIYGKAVTQMMMDSETTLHDLVVRNNIPQID